MSDYVRNSDVIDCVCLGPTGSGKTLLLKRLADPSSEDVDFTTTSVPTVGTTIIHLSLPNKKKIKVREIGGQIAPLWHHYLTDIKRIMFVIDCSNLTQISAAGVLFYGLLTVPSLRNAKILFVLAKMDASYRQMRNEALLMLQMKTLQSEVPQEITIVQASAYTSEGVDDILKWLQGEKIN